MSEIPLCYVVDASVGIKLFVEEKFSDKAQSLFAHLASETSAELHVPDLFYRILRCKAPCFSKEDIRRKLDIR